MPDRLQDIERAMKEIGMAGYSIAPMNTLSGRGVAIMDGEIEVTNVYLDPDLPTGHVDALLQAVAEIKEFNDA